MSPRPVLGVRWTSHPRGRKAWYWSPRAKRWFPMPAAEAELALATGAAEDVTKDYERVLGPDGRARYVLRAEAIEAARLAMRKEQQ